MIILAAVVTGLLFVEADHGDLHSFLGTVEQPLNALNEAELCPSLDALDHCANARLLVRMMLPRS